MSKRKNWDKVNATQKAIMRKMGTTRILEVDSGGDLTFEAEGKQYSLNTNGEVFPGKPTYHPDRPGPLPQTDKTGYFWTAINKDTGEITESSVPYTSTGRAMRGGRAFASRHWVNDDAKIEVWRRPHAYSEKTEDKPVTSELVSGHRGMMPQTMIERGMDYYKVPPEAY